MDTNRQFIVTQTAATPAIMTVEALTTEIKQELTIQVNGFVRIGFLLKTARDTDILSGTSYKDVMDYATSEFGLTKDVVSRYIHICEKYSQGGNSDKLLSEYAEFGYSKLAEMLTLPDSIAEEITPETTRQEIQEIKKEYREEQAVTPLERMAEEPLSVPSLVKEKAQEIGLDVAAQTMLGKALYLIGKERKQLFEDLCEAIGKEDERKRVREAMAPNEQALYTVRIPQTGKVLVSVKDESVTITSMRSGEKETHSIDEVADAFERLIETVGKYNDPPEELFSKLYKVAPVQPVKTDNNLQKSEQNSKEQQKTDNRQRDDSQKAAEEERAAAVPENGVLRSKNAASGDFINDPEEPETVKIDPVETEIVEKEIQIPKNEPVKTPESRISTPYDDMSPEELAETTRDLIRAWTLKFDTEPDDRRQPGADALIKYTESLIYHIREHKWLVAADCAKEITRAAEYINKMEDQIYEERQRD